MIKPDALINFVIALALIAVGHHLNEPIITLWPAMSLLLAYDIERQRSRKEDKA